MTPRSADGLRDLPAAARRWAARQIRGALCGAAAPLVVLLLVACASTPEPEPVTQPTRLVSGREMAAELGLSARPVDAAGRRVLTRGPGARIVFYDGSPLISVRGETLRAPVPVVFVDGDAWVDVATAGEIDRAWARRGSVAPRTGRAWLPPSPNDALPPPPSRVPSHGSPVARPAPAPATPSAPVPAANLPSQAELRAWSVPLRRSWHYLVLHHSATDSGSAASFHAAHKKKGWNGLGYDFVIGNGNGAPDGLIEVGYRWHEQSDGAHAGDKLMNQRGIGICLVGDFTKSRPTARQMSALERLTTFLARYCSISPQNVRLHRDFRDTECPGTYFPRDFAVTLEGSHRRSAVRAGDGRDTPYGARGADCAGVPGPPVAESGRQR